MPKLTLDAAFLQKLGPLTGEVELCNESGETLGFFVSPEVHHKFLYAWAKSLFTDEELARARAETGGVSTEEAIAHLRKLIESRGRKA